MLFKDLGEIPNTDERGHCWAHWWQGRAAGHSQFPVTEHVHQTLAVTQKGTFYRAEGFPSGSDSKESACNAGDMSSIPGSGRSPGDGNGYPLQYSCPENPMDRGTWQATVHRVAKGRTWLSDFRHTSILLPPLFCYCSLPVYFFF